MIPLGLTAAVSATDAIIEKKIYGSRMTTLIISKEEAIDIMKGIKSIEESDELINSETIQNEAK